MNKFEVKMITGDFDPFFQFFVDGIELDRILEEKCPGHYILDLYPTLSFDLEMDDERRVVWTRVLPKSRHSFCPILMCPDDQDFYCTLVSVEIVVDDNTVSWKRFGMDRSKPYPADNIGSEINWLDNSPSFTFSKVDYTNGLKLFAQKFKDDRIAALNGGYTFEELVTFIPPDF